MTSKVSNDPPRSGVKRRVWTWFAGHSDSRPVRLLRKAIHGALPYVHAENHDIRTNGETFVLDTLGHDAQTIFDVGAFRGDWALEAVARCPEATILCFEVATPTRDVLKEAVRFEPRVQVMPTGLADRAGPVRVKYYDANPALTSLFDYPHDDQATWRSETVSTGDDVMADTGCHCIDFLKIDVEGAEMAVLRGFRRALAARAARVIQFEYGYGAVFSHALLRDFYELLEPLGYVVGRLRKGGVDFAAYKLAEENFFGPNFVAVRREETAIVHRLQASR